MKRVSSGFLLALLSALLMCNAAALAQEKTVDLRPVKIYQPTELQVAPDLWVPSTCSLGNILPASWAVRNFLLPPEQYKLVVDPRDGCGECTVGFKVSAIHIALQTSSACQITLAVDLEDELFPRDPNCPFPGEVDCLSDTYTFDIQQAGQWNLQIPINCGCAYLDYTYLLGVRILDYACDDGSTPDLLTADVTNFCTNWNEFGIGWIDLPEFFPEWPGDLMIWADVECCDQPTAAERHSWGSVKARYE